MTRDKAGKTIMEHTPQMQPAFRQAVARATEAACRAIPPAWPLASSVAVNPYLGQSEGSLAEAGARLARVAGAPVTMPRDWFGAKIAAGEILETDIEAALAAAGPSCAGVDLKAVKAGTSERLPEPRALPSIADLAAEVSGIDWPGIIADRIGAWAGGFFDDGQALWAASRGKGAWRGWRMTATHDLTPEILGLPGFGARVDEAPDTAAQFVAEAAARLHMPSGGLETYFHRLLMTLGGWAQLARYRQWQAELAGGTDDTLSDCLAIRLFWDLALHDQYALRIADRWDEVRAGHARPLEVSRDMALDAVLQDAADRAGQRRIAELLAIEPPAVADGRPALQAAFCIDVRSEVFRRALEGVDPAIETLGFAGFFGLGTAHRGFASDVEELRLPVLLNPGLHSRSGAADGEGADVSARIRARAGRAWGRFKLAAVSSFAFVESAGPLYVGKLARDALGLGHAGAPADPMPRLVPEPDPASRIDAAETILRAMSLTGGFARLVLIAGHGAHVVNNPHASALQCGACGGYSGEVNARLLAALLNDGRVRAGLAGRGIDVPGDTLFLGALHDTTTDTVTLFRQDHDVSAHVADVTRAEDWLAAAGRTCRGERAARLPPGTAAASIPERARNWAEVRPEWALAGCNAFIAAPRSRTAGKSFGGRAFLHNYDWRADKGFGVLELIMTAPVVVASWISLQYHGSSVAPEVFGAGNKLLHNVVGGVGVVEGNGGVLRMGLPWQSVHDGERLMHDPLRLSVCVEAPREAMTDILQRHDGVRALFDNRWLHLFALDDAGRIAWRYGGDLAWQVEPAVVRAPAGHLAAS